MRKRFEEEFTPLALPDVNDVSAIERVMKYLEKQSDMRKVDSWLEINPTKTELTVPEDKRLTSQPFSLDPNQAAFVANTAPLISNGQQNITTLMSTEKNDLPAVPVLNTSDVVQGQLNAISKLLEIQNQNRLPLPEPGVFSGDPLQFPNWLKAFETLIESRALHPAERPHFLGKYVIGEGKDLIEGFMLLDGEDAYQKAKKTLTKRFGDSFVVATAFRKKLEAWPPISPNDAQGLRKYADFLVQCERAMDKISGLRILNDDQENHKLYLKLPRSASVRWGRLVYDWKLKNSSFPPFSELVRFLVMESKIACDLINMKKSRS